MTTRKASFQILRSALVLCAALLVGAINGQPSALEEARLALGQEDPQVQITALDSLRASGQESPALYQALGNAHYEVRDYGRAILAFERGLRLSPGNKALLNNLKFVRGEAAIDRPVLKEFFLVRGWRSMGSLLGVSLAKWLALLFWAGAVVGATLWYLRREQMAEKRRFALLPLSGFLLGLAVLFYLMGSSRQEFLDNDRDAILVSPQTELRVAPGADATLEEELSAGLKLRILDEFESYVKISLENGRQGWVRADALERI